MIIFFVNCNLQFVFIRRDDSLPQKNCIFRDFSLSPRRTMANHCQFCSIQSAERNLPLLFKISNILLFISVNVMPCACTQTADKVKQSTAIIINH